jgi:HAMP domain-containing protein
MKRKIAIGLAVYSVVFLLAGVYVIHTIRTATTNLDRLITLHQVEILREHYLLEIKRVQSDLMLKGTQYSRSYDSVVMHVMGMGRLIDACFDCHHSPRGMERLNSMKRQTEKYKDAISRVLTVRADTDRLAMEKDTAFRVGEDLILQVNDMIAFTTSRLEENTQKAMSKIEHTKYILYVLIAMGPLVSAFLGYIFISGLTRPVKVLVESARKLKGGDLDYRVTGLKDEFGEVAASFNEMAGSLKEQMQKMQRTEQMVVVGEHLLRGQGGPSESGRRGHPTGRIDEEFPQLRQAPEAAAGTGQREPDAEHDPHLPPETPGRRGRRTREDRDRKGVRGTALDHGGSNPAAAGLPEPVPQRGPRDAPWG